MLIEMKTVGKPTETLERELPLAAGPVSLRELLADLVRNELAAYEQRRDEQRLLRVLSAADLAEGAHSGRFRSGGRTVAAPPPLASAVARAEEAFRDGLYFVFVDDRQIDGLDDEVTITATSRLRLVRLVALAGG